MKKRFLIASLLTGLVIVSATIELATDGTFKLGAASTQAAVPVSPTRYNFYIASTSSHRFVYPEGYRLDAATFYRAPEPGSNLKESFEIWKEADYIPFGGRYQDDPMGAEWPPHISLKVFENPQGSPLENWIEPAESEPQTITVAGRGAIAYTTAGLYDYDIVLLTNPEGHVVKLQVGYLDADEPLRQVFRTVVNSLVFDTLSATDQTVEAIDYRHLQITLMASNWQAADLETRAIIMRLVTHSNYYYPRTGASGIEDLPCEDLQIIDALWSRHSDGRYGFTPQQQIWQSFASKDPITHAEAFGQQVGWRRETVLADEIFGDSLWRSDTELIYAADAPVGHFPWAGVSSLTTEQMYQQSDASCGSCAVDALYISHDRFPDYLNVFMTHIDKCLPR